MIDLLNVHGTDILKVEVMCREYSNIRISEWELVEEGEIITINGSGSHNWDYQSSIPRLWIPSHVSLTFEVEHDENNLIINYIANQLLINSDNDDDDSNFLDSYDYLKSMMANKVALKSEEINYSVKRIVYSRGFKFRRIKI